VLWYEPISLHAADKLRSVDNDPTYSNSWGQANGKKGFYLMNDSWFDQYLSEIVACHSTLPIVLRAALEAPPVVPAWDLMASLAGGVGP